MRQVKQITSDLYNSIIENVQSISKVNKEMETIMTVGQGLSFVFNLGLICGFGRIV